MSRVVKKFGLCHHSYDCFPHITYLSIDCKRQVTLKIKEEGKKVSKERERERELHKEDVQTIKQVVIIVNIVLFVLIT